MQIDLLTDWVHQTLLQGGQQCQILNLTVLQLSLQVKGHVKWRANWTSPSYANNVVTLCQHMAACGSHPRTHFGNVSKGRPEGQIKYQDTQDY